MADMCDPEFGKQFLDHGLEARGIWLYEFGRGADILFRCHPAKNRRLLRQVADTEPRAAVHGQSRYIVAIDFNRSGVCRYEPADHVEARRLARSIRAEQADDLSAP